MTLLGYSVSKAPAVIDAAVSFVTVPGALILGTTVSGALTAALLVIFDSRGMASTRQRWNHELKALQATLQQGRHTLTLKDVQKLQAEHLEALTHT